MNHVAVLLDKIKMAKSVNSDADLARLIGVTRASVSNWRHGRNLPDPVQCATIAGLSGEPLARVIGLVGEARAVSRQEKAVWHRLATAAALFFVLGLAAPTDAKAARTGASHSAGYALCEVY